MWSHSACQSFNENSFGWETLNPQNIKLQVITFLAAFFWCLPVCSSKMSLSKANNIKDWLNLISGHYCALNTIIVAAIVATCEADVL